MEKPENPINVREKDEIRKNWDCKFCNINNFASRDDCFKCHKSKSECEGPSDGSGNNNNGGGRDHKR